MYISKGGYVYILTNRRKNVLYIGVTSNLYTRIYDHKYENGSVFTKKYHCNQLVYYQFYDSIETAIEREKQLKNWKRSWKDKLISSENPPWHDLFDKVSDMQ